MNADGVKVAGLDSLAGIITKKVISSSGETTPKVGKGIILKRVKDPPSNLLRHLTKLQIGIEIEEEETETETEAINLTLTPYQRKSKKNRYQAKKKKNLMTYKTSLMMRLKIELLTRLQKHLRRNQKLTFTARCRNYLKPFSNKQRTRKNLKWKRRRNPRNPRKNLKLWKTSTTI